MRNVLFEGADVELGHQVRLGADYDTGLVSVDDRPRELLIEARKGLAHVQEQQRDIGAANGLIAARQREVLDRVGHLASAVNARGIHQGQRPPLPFKVDVDRIARGARDLADDDALLPEHRVHERRLAGVASAEHGDPQTLLIDHFAGGWRQQRGQLFEQRVDALALLRRQQRAPSPDPSRSNSARLRSQSRLSALFANSRTVAPGPAQQASHLLIQQGQTLARVDQEQHDLGRVQTRLDLQLDGMREIAVIDDADAPGVHQVKVEFVIDHAHRADQPVARDACGRLDNRRALADQAIEKRRFADVGPADNRDQRAFTRRQGNGHQRISSKGWI